MLVTVSIDYTLPFFSTFPAVATEGNILPPSSRASASIARLINRKRYDVSIFTKCTIFIIFVGIEDSYDL